MNQNLIEELTRFAIVKLDELRMNLLNMVDRLGDEEAAFQICWRTYQWPTGTPKSALEEFARRVSLKRLLDVERRHGISGVEEAAVGAAMAIPRFVPGRGFKVFRELFGELVKLAKAHDGSLVKYLKKFKNAKDLEDELARLPGIGPVLAPCLVRELRLGGIIKLDIKDLSLSLADPVRRVLERTKIILEQATLEDAEKAVRETFKMPPMLLDAGIWHIGFYYCREEPECDICPITNVCPKCHKGRG